MRLAVIVALNSDRTQGKSVTDVLPISEATVRFKELRKAGEFPEGFPRLVLSHITLDLEHRFTAPVAQAAEQSLKTEVPVPLPRKKRNPGDGQP